MVGLQLPHGLVLWKKTALLGIAELWEAQRALHQSAGGLQRPFSSCPCSFLESEHKLNGAQSQSCPTRLTPKGEPGAPNLCIGASPTVYSYPPGQLQAPQNAFASGWQGVQNKCGHSKKIHVLLNPVPRSNSSPPSNSLSLAAKAIPKGWVTGRRKGFFTANPE